MKILYVGSEAFPFVATGGLGDVLGSLPVEMAKLCPENDIRVVIPYYNTIPKKYSDEMTLAAEFDVHLAWRCQKTQVWSYCLKA